jgi:hypothetical protein
MSLLGQIDFFPHDVFFFFECPVIFDWIQDIVDLSFLDAKYFSTNIDELCSGFQLNYLETIELVFS